MNLPFEQFPVQDIIINQEADKGIQTGQTCAYGSGRNPAVLLILDERFYIGPTYRLQLMMAVFLNKRKEFYSTCDGATDGIAFSVVAKFMQDIALQMLPAGNP